MSFLWNNLLVLPLINLLVLFYKVLFSNFGLAIIAVTLLIRTVLIPLTLPALKAAQKQKVLSSELDTLKKKHKDDKKALAQAQMALYKKHGINPAAGCLPQVIQILILIALYQSFIRLLGHNSSSLPEINPVLYFPWLHFMEGTILNTRFLYLDLNQPDKYLILPIAAALSQFVLSKFMMPQTKKAEKVAEKTADKSDDMLYTMQEQSLYIMPLMTIFIGWRLPSGLILYWLATTLFSLGQQIAFKKYGRQS